MAWQLDPDALSALRDTLLERGAPSLRRGAALPAPGTADALLARVEPFLELLYLMMIADGKCATAELELLRGVARTLCGADLSSTAVDGLLAQFELTVRAEGEETRLESVANLLGADALDAQAAFTLAAAMALVDRDVEGPEDELLSRLAPMLGISSAKAKQLIGGS